MKPKPVIPKDVTKCEDCPFEYDNTCNLVLEDRCPAECADRGKGIRPDCPLINSCYLISLGK